MLQHSRSLGSGIGYILESCHAVDQLALADLSPDKDASAKA